MAMFKLDQSCFCAAFHSGMIIIMLLLVIFNVEKLLTDIDKQLGGAYLLPTIIMVFGYAIVLLVGLYKHKSRYVMSCFIFYLIALVTFCVSLKWAEAVGHRVWSSISGDVLFILFNTQLVMLMRGYIKKGNIYASWEL